MKLTRLLPALLLMAAPAFAADNATNPTVAKVNGENITRAELLAEARALPAQLQQIPLQQLYPNLLEQVITERVVRKAGYDAELQDSKEVKERMKEAEKKIVADEYLRQQVKKRMTDEKLKARYDTYVKNFKAAEEVRASHILVKTESEAAALIKEISGGADFAKLAAEKSIDKAAAAQGGDLGYFRKDDMVEPFAKAAFAMKAGDVSTKPVKTDFGWHVIKVVDKRQSKPDSFEKVKPELENSEAQVIAHDLVKELLQKAKIERFQLDGSPAAAKADASKTDSKKN